MNPIGIFNTPKRTGGSAALAAAFLAVANSRAVEADDGAIAIVNADLTPSKTISISDAMRQLDAAVPGMTIFEDIDVLSEETRDRLIASHRKLGLSKHADVAIFSTKLYSTRPETSNVKHYWALTPPKGSEWEAVFIPKKRKPKLLQRASRKERKKTENRMVRYNHCSRKEARAEAAKQLHFTSTRKEKIQLAEWNKQEDKHFDDTY